MIGHDSNPILFNMQNNRIQSLFVSLNLLFFVGLVIPQTADPAESGERKAARRLPRWVMPEQYDITLKPDLATGKFTGSETITIGIKQPIRDIWLHALDLKITNPQLRDAKGRLYPVTMLPAPKEEMVAFSAPRELAPGKYTLRTAFSGTLNDKLRGFYKAPYTDTKGKQQIIATTQMEPADARRMIPCFDEPDMKARFKITVHTLPTLTAISNAPMVRQTTSNNQKVVEFANTEPMSAYLLAVIVGDLESSEALLVEGVPIRVWSVRGMKHLTSYSRDAAAKLLPVLNQYFRIPYPWKKLDLIAVPDFAAGAMENPGAITFRDNLLLLDPKRASTPTQQRATEVIAHEMAHMWFGDLVTMKWWDDLWLNEAFATWMATKAVDTIRPEWQMWKEYGDARTAALDTDALHSTRSIHFEVKSPEQTHEMFDVITYEKGASVLRMLERYVGEPVFQKGVHLYLQKHSFGNATTSDLWNSIGGVSGAPVNDLMYGWVHQPGYPLITVNESTTTPGSMNLEQQRFLILNDRVDKTIWSVPIGIRVATAPVGQNQQSQPDRKCVLSKSQSSVPLPLTSDPAVALPIIANAGGVGYYRVRYSDPMFTRLIDVPRTNLDPSERFALIDDSSALMASGNTSVTRYLDLISRYKDETDEQVWSSITHDLYYFDRFVDEAGRKPFERFVRAELTDVFARVGWDPKPSDTPQIRLLRANVLTALGTIGQDETVLAEARRRFGAFLSDKNSLDRDLVSPVATIVAYNGTAKEYEQFKAMYKTAPTPEERVRALHMLPEFKSPDLVDQSLELSLGKEVRLQDAPHLLGGILRRRQMQDRAWQFITKNWDRMRSVYPEDMVPGVVSSAEGFSTESQLAELKSFLDSHPVPSGTTAVARTIERVSANVRFRQKQAADLNQWLQSHYSG